MRIRNIVNVALVVTLTTSLHAAEIFVFAAASLTDALKEVAPEYELESGDKLVFNFAGSNALARQIKEGAPADVFFSADEIQMDNLDKAGLIEPGHATTVSNTPVIVREDGPMTTCSASLPNAGFLSSERPAASWLSIRHAGPLEAVESDGERLRRLALRVRKCRSRDRLQNRRGNLEVR
jgi:ABC-type molybdate transport system substrate-binding protein